MKAHGPTPHLPPGSPPVPHLTRLGVARLFSPLYYFG